MCRGIYDDGGSQYSDRVASVVYRNIYCNWLRNLEVIIAVRAGVPAAWPLNLSSWLDCGDSRTTGSSEGEHTYNSKTGIKQNVILDGGVAGIVGRPGASGI